MGTCRSRCALFPGGFDTVVQTAALDSGTNGQQHHRIRIVCIFVICVLGGVVSFRTTKNHLQCRSRCCHYFWFQCPQNISQLCFARPTGKVVPDWLNACNVKSQVTDPPPSQNLPKARHGYQHYPVVRFVAC
jgi:hypothetical protein